MNKNKGPKAISQFVGLLLCIMLIQSAFAAESKDQFTISFINNSTSENATFENSTMENASTENPVIGNTTIEDPIGENETIEDPIIEDALPNSIDPSYYYTYLTAGYNTTFAVRFTNNGNESLILTPKVIATTEMNSLDESWITISPANATLAPGTAQYFTIEESIPWDTAGGYHTNKIAFTDDIVPYTEGYYTDTEYVNQMYLYTYVYGQPKIELQSSYISDTVDAGTENEYKIKIRNVAPRDLTINPTLSTSNDYYYEDQKQAFGDEAIEIIAPSTIKAGEIANITIRVNVPENSTGTYNRYIDMNVNGRANDETVPHLNLNFRVWKPPVPFVKTFYTTTDAPITIEVSGNMYSLETGLRVSEKKDKPPFELGLTCNSIPVNIAFEESAESGSADIEDNNYYYPVWANEYQRTYRNINDHYVATYKAPGAIGEWQLSILPKGVRNFQYLIKIKESNQKKIWNISSENADSGNSSTENGNNENIPAVSTKTPVADFNSNVTHGCSPFSVQFTDLSENATEWFWDFGDNTYSTTRNPVHTYNETGKYTVSLTVRNEKGTDTENKSRYISVSKK